MRHLILALALVAASFQQEEEPIVRRSTHQEGPKVSRIELPHDEPVSRDMIGFVDVPANLEKRAKTLFDVKAPVKVVTVPGSGEANLYLLWTRQSVMGAELRVNIFRSNRVITASLFENFKAASKLPVEKGKLHGFMASLGPLEAGGWTVLVAEDKEVTRTFTFVAGPGGPEPKGIPVDRRNETDLPAFLAWPGTKMEHGLVAFACKPADYDAVLAFLFGVEGAPKPAPLTSGDELVLYVLWGRRVGWPDAYAEFDRKASAIRVTARWAGAAGMKTVQTAPYAGYGFKLGPLDAGTYCVDIFEIFPTNSDEKRSVKKLSIDVKARP